MKNDKKYFISFYYATYDGQNGFGHSTFEMNNCFKRKDDIDLIVNDITKTYRFKAVIILNIQRLPI